ncbi:hypothetical protein [Lysobacter sp. HA18]
MSVHRVMFVPLLAALAACATGTPVARTTPKSMALVCGPGGDIACFERASDLCRPNGYDLFDRDGRPATVADAQVRIVEACCRP